MGVKSSGGYNNTTNYVKPKGSPGMMMDSYPTSSRPIKSSVKLGKGGSMDPFYTQANHKKMGVKTTGGYK